MCQVTLVRAAQNNIDLRRESCSRVYPTTPLATLALANAVDEDDSLRESERRTTAGRCSPRVFKLKGVTNSAPEALSKRLIFSRELFDKSFSVSETGRESVLAVVILWA
jgi:hypothetical protein